MCRVLEEMFRRATDIYRLSRLAQSYLEGPGVSYTRFIRQYEFYQPRLDSIYKSIYTAADRGLLSTYVSTPIPPPIRNYLHENGFTTDANRISWVRTDVDSTSVVNPVPQQRDAPNVGCTAIRHVTYSYTYEIPEKKSERCAAHCPHKRFTS